MRKKGTGLQNINISFKERGELKEIIKRLKAALPYTAVLSLNFWQGERERGFKLQVNSKVQTLKIERVSLEKSFANIALEAELELLSILKVWRRERCVFEHVAV